MKIEVSIRDVKNKHEMRHTLEIRSENGTVYIQLDDELFSDDELCIPHDVWKLLVYHVGVL